MDIQKVFLKQANINLNSSLAVLISAAIYILLTIFVFSNRQIMVLIIPFIIYSFILFQSYLLNYNRYLVSSRKIKRVECPDFLRCHEFLLHFDNDEKEILFLHPSGIQLGKLYKKKELNPFQLGTRLEFILEDLNKNHLASYYKNKNIVDVYRSGEGYIGGFSNENKGTFKMLSGEIIGRLNKSIFYWDDQIENKNGQVIVRVRKGWMPLKYQELFRNPNTPMLSISSLLDDEERILYLSLLVKRFF